MFPDNQGVEVRDVIRALMEYLVENPDAKDTIEGIQRWWLAGWSVEPNRNPVERTLVVLVRAGWMRTVADARAVYEVTELGLRAGTAYLNHLHLNTE